MNLESAHGITWNAESANKHINYKLTFTFLVIQDRSTEIPMFRSLTARFVQARPKLDTVCQLNKSCVTLPSHDVHPTNVKVIIVRYVQLIIDRGDGKNPIRCDGVWV